MEKIRLIVFDFDGVLTDNRVWVSEDGKEWVCCNRSDGLAFDLFRMHRVPTLILSTERNKVVKRRAEKLQTPVLNGIKNKADALKKYCWKMEIDLKKVMFVGNDINDLSALRIAGYPICPADAHPDVKRACRRVLKIKGGYGVAREIAENILNLKTGKNE